MKEQQFTEVTQTYKIEERTIVLDIKLILY